MSACRPSAHVPAEPAVGAEHPVAGHVRRERVRPHGGADGARAGVQMRGQRGVGRPAAGGDGEEGEVDAPAVGG